MSVRTVGEIVAVIGVLVGLVFVGLEIRQNNKLARAAAYQAIGIATSEYWLNRDDRLNRLYTESAYPEALRGWTLSDWEMYSSNMQAGLMASATAHLQVKLDLLEEDALESLGFSLDDHRALATPGFACLWPVIRSGGGGVSAVLRPVIDEAIGDYDFECPIDLQALYDQVADSSVPRSD